MNIKKVLVTGASKGIGQAIAIQLAKDGFEIGIHYRTDQDGAKKSLEEIQKVNGLGHLLQFDISDRETCRKKLNEHIQSEGAYYGVVCNAGISRDTAFPAMSNAEWDDVIHTNLDGFFNVLQPCIMPMIRQKNGGRILSISSAAGRIGNRGQVNYSASKAGLIGATKALALELATRKITVNCIAPGLIDTDMIAPEVFEQAKSSIPMERMGTPGEVASLASYLFSKGAGYITRQVISVDGGLQ